MTAIIFVGVLSALLVVPQVRAVAAGLLASSAVVGLVVGLAAQRPLANFVAGIVIAFTQPLRLGDTVTVDDVEGVVEEIGLTYTFIKTHDNAAPRDPEREAGLGYDSATPPSSVGRSSLRCRSRYRSTRISMRWSTC